jgi:hypothetical protein
VLNTNARTQLLHATYTALLLTAAATDPGNFPLDATTTSSSGNQAWDTPITSTDAADAAPLYGSSSSTDMAIPSNQPYSYTGSTVAANSYTLTYRHPCSYPDVCKHFGRCVPYGWTFTCDCPEGWGGELKSCLVLAG